MYSCLKQKSIKSTKPAGILNKYHRGLFQAFQPTDELNGTKYYFTK